MDTLPDIDRAEPPVVAMEARLCIVTGEWERGLKRAYLCEVCDDEQYKIAAAEFYHAYAAHLWGEGEHDRAVTYIKDSRGHTPCVTLPYDEDDGLQSMF